MRNNRLMRWQLLDKRLRFPDPRLADEDGLVAVGGDMSVERLLLAYRSGIFPWTIDPITWWSPDPRAIMELDQFHVSRSLVKTLRTCSADFLEEIRCVLSENGSANSAVTPVRKKFLITKN